MTIGRNDPCPCGSGKKYKNCCLSRSDVVSLQQFRDKRTSDSLLDRLVSYTGGGAMNREVATALPRFFGSQPPKDPQPEELGLPMDWIMFNYRSPELGTTLCQHFADHADGLTAEERAMVSGWSKANPGFFRVSAVVADEVQLCRLGDEQAYAVTASGTGLKAGELVAASLLPVPAGFRFGVSLFSLPTEIIGPLEYLLREELGILRRQRPDATWDDLYRACWPRLIDDARSAEARGEALVGARLEQGPAVQGHPVDDAKWCAVADRLAKELVQGEAVPEEVEGGLRLWWDAVHVIRPRVIKTEIWAGAVIYLLSNRIYGSHLTQADVAESLGTSAGTVGARARQIEAALDVRRLDNRYVDLLDRFVRSEWRFDCLTMTKDGTHDYTLLRNTPLLWPAPSDDPELDDAEMFRARDLVDLAWEAEGKERIRLAEQAIRLWPDATDAYVILGNEALNRGDLQRAQRLYQDGVQAGERELGNECFTDDVGHFWGIVETRPYMRARRGLADSLWLLGQHDAAIAHYEELLRLNPNDNQGIRYILASHLLELGDDLRLGKLLKAHADDGMAALIYTRALWEFRQNGSGRAADKWLTEAVKQNRHVPAFLLKERPVPTELPDYIGWGDESEAAAYAAEFGVGWLNTPGALEWLAAKTGR